MIIHDVYKYTLSQTYTRQKRNQISCEIIRSTPSDKIQTRQEFWHIPSTESGIGLKESSALKSEIKYPSSYFLVSVFDSAFHMEFL